MSRHRAVRNLDLGEELADDYSDGEHNAIDDLSPEDSDALEQALLTVIDTLGEPEQCGISDRTMKEAIWETYFDVPAAVDMLLQEKEREEALARKRVAATPSMQPRGSTAGAGLEPCEGPGARPISPAPAPQPAAADAAGAPHAGRPRRASPPRSTPSVGDARADAAAPTTPTPTGKPLSKLQQKMLASRARKAPGSGSGDASPASTPGASTPPPAAAAVHAPANPPVSTVPSGMPITELFPPRDACVELNKPAVSKLADVFATASLAVSRGTRDEWRTDGGMPSVTDAQMQQLRDVFSTLSPDDVSPATGPVQQLRSSLKKMQVVGDSAHGGSNESARGSVPSTPKLSIAREQILEELHRRAGEGAREMGLVVVGHVDAGKSTLMGRMLHEFGHMSDRDHQQHARNSAKIGKGSFAYAWALDSSEEERTRGVTIDVAQDTFRTEKGLFHLLDAPGHQDFVPNMISGAAQADAAVLVVDASLGAFEAGFGARGQTREHATLLRSLGVQQVVVVVNKLDVVAYSAERFDEIRAQLEPFLAHCGFDLSTSVQLVPCAAAAGENLLRRTPAGALGAWYHGATLAEALDRLRQPPRQYDAPLRLPVANVFRSGAAAISSGLGVAGRIVSGLVQVGEPVRPLPGDETAVVKGALAVVRQLTPAIECEGNSVRWAAAGSSVTLYLTHIEPNQVNIGSVMCAPTAPIPLCTATLVQVLVFQPTYPLVNGTAVELYHHSADIPAQIVELVALLDKSSGEVVKGKPRVLPHSATALIRVALGGAVGRGGGYPMEEFRQNKEMARLLFRMNGETVAAGIVVEAT
ncbi:hypothetical protein MSPP1_002869 [Malassezia sp. CBS 17886]|nr:hypothetical protein MSPP1_002869 [Malassezia sp. CBS 17886]